jgi:5-methylcytosine-specific restriction endonuclease McrA
MEVAFVQHGRGAYRRGCRCDECREAHNAYMREYRRRDTAKVARRALRRRRLDQGKDPLWDASRKAAYQRRRAQKKSSAWADRVMAEAVFDRDDWVCGICNAPVDPELQYPDPMSASLDHVAPLSLGGDHTEANTRCSHLRCNVRRGNRVA